jgi:hypothetical protein
MNWKICCICSRKPNLLTEKTVQPQISQAVRSQICLQLARNITDITRLYSLWSNGMTLSYVTVVLLTSQWMEPT